jgi:hypothetical protein
MRTKDLTGLTFGRWTVLEYKGVDKNTKPLWLCRCECGNEKVVFARSLVRGASKSCGCLRKESNTARLAKRNSGHKLYDRLSSMKQRCYNPKNEAYKYYGGRGVRVCDEWLNDSQLFVDWALANGWQEGLEIDRIDNDGDYSPNNCQWVTDKINSRNRSNARLATIEGITLSIPEWADKAGLTYSTVAQRVKAGWSGADIIAPPISESEKKRRRVEGLRKRKGSEDGGFKPEFF